LPALRQHQSFLGTDHPATQFAKPALQSYGGELVPCVTQPPLSGQPFPCTLQWTCERSAGEMHICSRTASVRWGAALSAMGAAPLLLVHAPTCHPIGEAGIAIVGRRSRGAWCAAPSALVRATLAMHAAAPPLLSNRPARLPVGEAICAIVWVGGTGSWGRLPADVVIIAAPLLLRLLPRGVRSDGAVVGISWRQRNNRLHWRPRDDRPGGKRDPVCGGHSRRRRWRGRRALRYRLCCASQTDLVAAIVPLRL